MTVPHVTRFSDVGIRGSSHKADVYLPRRMDRDTTVLVNFHGGGWYTGDKSLASLCCAELARRGLIVVNANYGIREEDPVPLMVADSIAAIAWVRAGTGLPDGVGAAASEGICLAGDSAGSHIAALASAALREPELADLLHLGSSIVANAGDVSSLVSWSGALSLGELVVDENHPDRERFNGYVESIGGGSRDRLSRLDPLSWLSERTPPVLAFTSALDFFHDATTSYVAAAVSAGYLATEVDYDGTHPACKHSWQLDPDLAESRETYDLTAEFAKAHR